MKAHTYRDTDLLPETPFNIWMSYDQWQLRLRLEFMYMDAPVYVTFENIFGFRMLYESDLLEYWNPTTRPDGWIWTVEAGGWYDLEKSREDFVSGLQRSHGLQEYLIISNEECLSVLSTKAPVLRCEDIPQWNTLNH